MSSNLLLFSTFKTIYSSLLSIGDTLILFAQLITLKQKFGIAKFKGSAYTDGDKAMEVFEMTFAFKPISNPS